ncbi:MAG: EpsI family protein [bacterium]|nr:EpsI family protein [bacterium]
MSRTVRLAATLIAVLIPLLGVWRFIVLTEAPPGTELSSDLPAQIGPWKLTSEEQLDANILEIISPLTYVMRLYEAPGRMPIWIYVGMYAGRAGYLSGAHDPKVCYPAQGWEVLESKGIEVDVGDEEMHATLLAAHRDQRSEAVLYWFQPAGRWSSRGAYEQIRRMFDAVAGQPQYAFVRLSGSKETGPDSNRDLIEFATTLAPSVRGAVERLL